MHPDRFKASMAGASSKRALLEIAFERDKKRCFWCEKVTRKIKVKQHQRAPADQATIDHIQTVAAGGQDVIGNVLLSCWQCNTRRGSIPAELYLAMTAHLRKTSKKLPTEKCDGRTFDAILAERSVGRGQ